MREDLAERRRSLVLAELRRRASLELPPVSADGLASALELRGVPRALEALVAAGLVVAAGGRYAAAPVRPIADRLEELALELPTGDRFGLALELLRSLPVPDQRRALGFLVSEVTPTVRAEVAR